MNMNISLLSGGLGSTTCFWHIDLLLTTALFHINDTSIPFQSKFDEQMFYACYFQRTELLGQMSWLASKLLPCARSA